MVRFRSLVDFTISRIPDFVSFPRTSCITFFICSESTVTWLYLAYFINTSCASSKWLFAISHRGERGMCLKIERRKKIKWLLVYKKVIALTIIFFANFDGWWLNFRAFRRKVGPKVKVNIIPLYELILILRLCVLDGWRSIPLRLSIKAKSTNKMRSLPNLNFTFHYLSGKKGSQNYADYF